MTDQKSTNCQSRKVKSGRQDGHLDPDGIPEEDTLCCCPPTCSPSWLQRLANPKVFTLHMMIITSFSMMSFIYLGGVLTTIERNFQLDSATAGSLTIAADIISTLLTIPLSHYGQMGHRPRWIGTGMLLNAVGAMLCAVPHFVSDPINPKIILTGSMDEGQDICSTMDEDHLYYNVTESTSDVSQSYDGLGDHGSSKGIGTMWWIILGQFISGIGNAPLQALIMTYIDDAVKKHNLTAYSAVLCTALVIGSSCGYLFAALTTKLYVDFDRVESDQIPSIDQNDPRWIGAWWLGFVILSIIIAVLSLPIFFYPKTLPSAVKKWKQEKKQADVEEDMELNVSSVEAVNADYDDNVDDEEGSDLQGRSGTTYVHIEGNVVDTFIKGPIRTLKRLFCNPTNMCLVIEETAIIALLAIEGAFGVKYVETQFSLSPSQAALLTALTIGPANFISNILSGYVCRRFKLNIKQCCFFMLVCSAVSFTLLPMGMLLGCDNAPIAGVTTFYNGSIASSNKISNECNLQCACSDEIFQPVCGSNGLTYISPCHAGCHIEISRFNNTTAMSSNAFQDYEYSNCNCISKFGDVNESTENLFSSTQGSSDVEASAGQCPNSSCQGTISIALLLTTIYFFQGAIVNPMIYISLRCVRDEDRSMAIALRSVFAHFIGFFPAPIYFGAIINSVCILWQTTDGEKGACWLYDNRRYRFAYFGSFMALQGIGLLALICMYFSIKEKLRNKKRKGDGLYGNLDRNDVTVQA